MTRISENQVQRALLTDLIRNRGDVNKYGQELSTGKKVHEPGDSKLSGTIADFQDSLVKIEGYQNRVSFAEGFLLAQDNALSSAQDLLIRAKEIAEQGANETNSEVERKALAQEMFEIRDHMVSLANSQYLGRFIFSGNADNIPAYSRSMPDYASPGDGSLADYHYAYNNNPGADQQRDVQITDNLNVPVNRPGNLRFDNAVYALERLGRALDGFTTDPPLPDPLVTPLPAPDPTLASPANDPYTFPADYTTQTADILASLDMLDIAREQDIMPERADLAGRLRRLDTARSLLDLSELNAVDVLSKLQDADLTESASNLAQAQTALQAAFSVTNQILSQSILDYI
jgi:flagellar hook-associated protein 3 FlgL